MNDELQKPDVTGPPPDLTDSERDGKLEGQVDWSMPDVGTPEEEQKKHAFKPFAEGIYILECLSVAMVERPVYMKPNEKEVQLEWHFQVQRQDGKPVTDMEGKAINKPTFRDWSRPDQTGLDKSGRQQKTAAYMRALANIPRGEPIMKPTPEMFEGKKFQATCEIAAKQNGAGLKNVWSGFVHID